MITRISFRTLRSKILFLVLFCFIIIGLPSLFLLYSYMNSIVYQQVNAINDEIISKEIDTIDNIMQDLVNSVAWISQNTSAREAMKLSSSDSSLAKSKLLQAHNEISTYMSASMVWPYLNKVVVFNDNDVFFECISLRNGNLEDVELIKQRDEFRNLAFKQGTVVKLFDTETLNNPKDNAIVAYGRIVGIDAWIYVELNTSIFDDLLMTSPIDNTFVLASGWSLPIDIPSDLFSSSYVMNEKFIPTAPDIKIVSFIEKSQMHFTSLYGLTIFIIILIAAILMTISIGILITRIITNPTKKLAKHIEMLTDKQEFGIVDKEIEKGNDEISQIGHTINEMSLSISNLLEKNEKLFNEKKTTELNMLQMQVNPHFLYNTLESIHYLAQIQKADGIASMSRGLSTLLKNMAKGCDDHITIREELELLHDYDLIQQVRYMGMYEIIDNIPEELKDYRIQKFTLQPLVENAIFHGIEPTGRDGVITLSGYKDDKYLYISVLDDGIGIPENSISLVYDVNAKSKGNMTGVGIKNINERLSLSYGEECGLSFSSIEGKFTKATVKILLEM